MATVEECRAALEQFTEILGGADADARSALRLDRSVSCRITDLGAVFSGRLRDGAITGLTDAPAPKAQIRLETASDDLVDLVGGRLAFAPAWASGRIKVHASMRDLLQLRKLL